MTSKPFFAATLTALVLGLVLLRAVEALAQAGPMGSAVQIYSGGSRWPAVAYDQVNSTYLVVFGSGGAIKGRFVAEDGSALGGAFTISGSDYAQTPRVAYGAGGFLVTWHGWDGVTGHGWAVRSRPVTYPGGAVGTPNVLSEMNTLGEMGPSVEYASGSGRFLVAWVANWNIGARLVDTSGTPVGGEFSISGSTSESDRDPTVSYFPASNRFLVVWSAYNDPGHYSTAKGQLVDASSGAAAGSAIQLGQSGLIYVPELTYNSSSGRMFVAWMQGYSGGFRPFGAHVDGNGSLIAPAALLSSTVGTYDANSVAYNARTNTYFLVTQPPGTSLLQDYGFEISSAGVPLATAASATNIPEVPGYIGAFHPRLAPSTQEGRWLIGTVGSFTSVWTQLIGGNATQPPPTPPPTPPPGGGGGTYSLTISPPPGGGSVSGGGLLCGSAGSTCTVTPSSATALTISAVPVGGYTFSGWSGACTGTNPTINVTVDGVKTCTATFTATGGGTTYPLSISPAPVNGKVSGGGLSCGTGGSACQVTVAASTSVTLTAAADTGYWLTGWAGDCSGTSPTVTVTVGAAKTCSATFTQGPATGAPYTLTVTKPTGGTVLGAGLHCGDGGTLCSVNMPASMTIGITAAASSGYTFTGWTGDCSGTTSSVWVALNGPRTCGATFKSNTAPTYRLTISPAPTGGTVTGSGVNCGVGGAACDITFGSPITATLTAAPASGYTFTNWSGSCSGTSTSTTVQVDAAKTCSATFTQGPATGAPFTLTVAKPTGGTVLGAGLHCGDGGTLCSVNMPASMTIGITAAASTGHTFTGWTGDCSGTASSIWVSLNGPRTCGATFTSNTAPTYRLTISPAPTGGAVTGNGLNCGAGGATCLVTFGSATTATITATPAAGYTFSSWGGSCSGTSATTTVQVDTIRTCSATFASASAPPTGPPYTLSIIQPVGGRVAGAGLNCGAGGTLCSVTMPAAMTIGISAAASAGYTFSGWTGNCSGTASGLWVALNGPRTCGAIFTPTGGGSLP